MRYFIWKEKVYINLGSEGGGNLTGLLHGKFYSIPENEVAFIQFVGGKNV